MSNLDVLYALDGITPPDGPYEHNEPYHGGNITLDTTTIERCINAYKIAPWSIESIKLSDKSNTLHCQQNDIVQYTESDKLTTIDGFAVTSDHIIRITIRATLTNRQKAQGTVHLIHMHLKKREPAVYLWNTSDTDE